MFLINKDKNISIQHVKMCFFSTEDMVDKGLSSNRDGEGMFRRGIAITIIRIHLHFSQYWIFCATWICCLAAYKDLPVFCHLV